MTTTHSITPRLTLAALVSILILSTSSFSQSSITNQIVTLQVVELNALSVSSRLVPFSIEMVDQEAPKGSTRLIWTSNGEDRKITVARRVARMEKALRVVIQEPTYEHLVRRDLELTGATTMDLLCGLSKSAGSCTIQFSLSSDGVTVQSKLQSVIYTITGG